MKLGRPKPDPARRDRREILRRERAAAPNLRAAYPLVAQLRMNLKFADGSALPPASQLHILHPPAPAFFRFCCPFADCDGQFDLSGPVATMLSASQRTLALSLRCEGTRARDRQVRQPCELQGEFTIDAEYALTAAA
jgi:hypothetical protein